MSITVKAPFELEATLAAMRTAKASDGLMRIWDRDIKAVEEAVATIKVLRDHGPQAPKSTSSSSGTDRASA